MRAKALVARMAGRPQRSDVQGRLRPSQEASNCDDRAGGIVADLRRPWLDRYGRQWGTPSAKAKIGVILPDSKSWARSETADRKYLEEAFKAAAVG